jgi:hypothetical protein
MQPLIETRRNELAELCRKHQVKSLALFGSALTTDFVPERSDLDFLVEFVPLAPGEHARRYFALQSELERLFGDKVDLVEAEAVKNPYVRREIEATRETLYAA